MSTKPERPIACPRCGAPMNRHAEKLVESVTPPPGAKVDPVGGWTMEVHACPRCGALVSRPA